jgi:IS30 family transposase
LSVRAVATAVGRDAATVSRELRRNADLGSGRYRPFAAHRMAADRRPRPRTGKLAADPELREFVQDRLGRRWSPEQICQQLPVAFPDDPGRHLAHETIYQAVYRPDLGGLSRQLPARVLRSGRRRRKPHRKPDARRRGVLVGMTMLDDRPAEAVDRAVPGHWEGDLIMGAGNRSAIGTWSSGRPGSPSCCTCPADGTAPNRSVTPSPPRCHHGCAAR